MKINKEYKMAIIVFIVTFLVARLIFSNLDKLKELLF
jgi:hypothetical protein